MSAKKTTTKKPAAAKTSKAKSAKATTPKAAAPAKAAKPKKAKADGKMSALDAAAKVLAEVGEAMSTKQMIEAMAAKNYWISPGGATPRATLYSALHTEINARGNGRSSRIRTEGS